MTPKRRAAYGSGAKPYQRPSDGLWVARIEGGYTATGTRKRITVSAKTEAECKRRLKERQRELAAGQARGINVRETVKSWADKWLPIHATHVRPTTYTTDAGTIRKWIIPTLGHRRLADLTPADLRDLREAITSAGRSSTTAAHAHRVFRKMLRDAIIEGHTVPTRVLEVHSPTNAPNDRTAIPIDQALAILHVIESRDDAAFWVARLLQGMRSGEARGLTWDHVDLDVGVVDVSWQLQYLTADHTTPDGWEARHLTGLAWLTRPKTASGKRPIPIVPWMSAALVKARADWTPNPWGLVWVDAKGKPIRKEDDLAAFHEIQRQANIAHPSGRPWHGHEMRHTTVSLLLALGVERSVVQRIVGQSKLVESYVHVDQRQARAALDQAAERLGLTLPPALEA